MAYHESVGVGFSSRWHDKAFKKASRAIDEGDVAKAMEELDKGFDQADEIAG